MKVLEILGWIGMILVVSFFGTLRAMLTFNADKAGEEIEWVKTFLFLVGLCVVFSIVFSLIL